MRKLVLLAAAAMLAGQAVGQTPSAPPNAPPPGDMWVYVRFADGAMGWNLQAGRWFDNNDTAEGQRLTYYAEPQDVDGVKIVWAQEFWRIKCNANTYQIKSGEELTAELGTAFKLNEGEPVPIRDGTTEWVLKQVYCDNAEFDGAQHVTGIIEAMIGMKAPAQ